ncbi:MAG: 3' terminal RNA ribose 2'-O-methyltransferase Hen1 [Chloroflexi bacterium]|nr:3' terminal RNA ribose 2'-O-methyltransferase Hen1 [Chloroflexota bacterium]MCC6893405.1 3' terminal RNA ribose 2'-O-methyltransferase Hen1 [Anaerolineae bacterium]
MLLTISTTHQPATDLGYLLVKHPDKVQTFNLAFGKAHVFYPEATDDLCTAALLLEINPVGLVRNGGAERFALDQYVNDRPYVASSFLSVAIAQVFATAMAGTNKDRAELAQTAIPLQMMITALPCRGGESVLRKLFEPLGYSLLIDRQPLDTRFPEWGESMYYTVHLSITARLMDALSHIYVLIPVLDDEKHYYVGSDEVNKLLRHGEGWLAAHPERDLIAARYLKHQHRLKREAIAQLADNDGVDEEAEAEKHDAEEQIVEHTLSLHEQRLGAVLAVLKASGASRVLDLGCGEGRLLSLLLKEKSFTQILGMDVSVRALETAVDRLHLDTMPPRLKERLKLIHGSLLYRDERLNGYDAAAVVEVIEHLDQPRLTAFEHIVFGFARPRTVIVTTPNAEYNVMWESLPAGKFRHRDHRFEWSREEFAKWANRVAAEHGYRVKFLPIGPENTVVGAPSQMGVFEMGSEVTS